MNPFKPKKKITLAYGVKGSLWSAGIHKGVDFATPVGAEVLACVPGKVIHVGPHDATGWGTAFGVHVIVDCDKFPDGSAGLWIGYMHLSKTAVKVGQRIKAGQKIGLSGNTGHVTGPHLHVEVQKQSRWNAYRSVNPQKWLDYVPPAA